jgi:hypothetical protein
MQDRTVPRLPKLPELTWLQALLLLGGAFVFASLIWGARRYDVYVDRTPSAPENAVFAATIDRSSPDWPAFESKLPEKARQALAVAAGLKSVTLFAVPGTGVDLEWWTVEAMNAVTERTGRQHLRLVPKGTTAVGYISARGRAVPFEATVTHGLIQARVGRDFLGLDLDPRPFERGRRHLVPMYMQSAYLEKPSGVSWTGVASLLGEQLQRFQPQASIWRLPGRLELSVSASETRAVSPFVLYYRPAYGVGLSGPVLEDYAKGLLAESDPIGFEVTMPDDTQMIELRRDPDSVVTVRKTVNKFGERAQLRVPGSTHKMEIFYDDDGEAWMSNDLNLIQASVMGSVGAEDSRHDCEKGGKGGFADFSGKSLETWPLFKGMDRLTFSIHNIESGMFTTCGYFTP